MSNQSIALKAKNRQAIGKGLQAIRRSGQVPAVLHNHGKQSLHIQAEYIKLAKAYQAAGKSQPVQLDVEGKKHLAIIKDVDTDPVKQKIRHVVFQAIRQNEKVEAEVPLVFEGEAPAERKSLLVLTQLDTVQVEALPKNLIENLKVDITNLDEVGDRLTVGDIEVPQGVTVLTDPEQQIAIVEMPRDQVAEADAAAEDLAADASGDGPDVPSDQGGNQDSDNDNSDAAEKSNQE